MRVNTETLNVMAGTARRNDMPPLKIHHAHGWDLTPKEACEIQERLAPLVDEEPLDGPIRHVAGVDVGVREGCVRAAVSVLSCPDLVVVDHAVWDGPVTFPYVPGLLSFREIPSLFKALEQLEIWPDLIIADGQGYAHPRRFGLACHLGVLLDMPVFGVAKSRLIGIHEEPAPQKRASVPLLSPDGRETIGAVLRTRDNVKPVYVSIGHKVTLEDAVEMTLRLTTRYRLPETTRAAHRLSNSEIRNQKAELGGPGEGS